MNTTLYQNLPEDTQNWTNLYLEPHDYWIYYVNIDLRHQYGIFAAESQTFLHAKRPQWRRARRNGCFHRLGVSIINHIWGDTWLLQGSGNFTVLFLRSVISLKLPSCAVVLSWFCPLPPSGCVLVVICKRLSTEVLRVVTSRLLRALAAPPSLSSHLQQQFIQ